MTRIINSLINAALWLVLLGAIVWGAIAPGIYPLCAIFVAICAAIALLYRKTDYITRY